MLGQASWSWWDTSLAFSTPGSPVGVEVSGVGLEDLIEEVPRKIGSDLYLSYVPTGLLEVWYKNTVLSTLDYTEVTGTVTLLKQSLIDGQEAHFRVKYRTPQYSLVRGGGVVSIAANDLYPRLQQVLVQDSVKITDHSEKDVETRWDRSPGTVSGSTAFL
jgi:hypothetical protein